MRRLTLKDIAGYMPYGLMFQAGNAEFLQYEAKAILEQVNNVCILTVLEGEDKLHQMSTEIYKLKPLLRPLSCLAEEITVGNKEIIPIKELAQLESVFEIYVLLVEHVSDNQPETWACHYESDESSLSVVFGFDKDGFFKKDCREFYVKNQFLLFEKLDERLIDYRRLIDAGLALPLST